MNKCVMLDCCFCLIVVEFKRSYGDLSDSKQAINFQCSKEQCGENSSKYILSNRLHDIYIHIHVIFVE